MRIGMALSVAVVMLIGATALLQGNSTREEASLQGTWTLVSGEAGGKAMDAKQIDGGKLTIDGDRYTVILPEVGTLTGVQKLGKAEKLKTIDIVDDKGNNGEKTCLGIYEVKGDEFHVAFATPGEPRPEQFKTKPETTQWMHVWKRVSK